MAAYRRRNMLAGIRGIQGRDRPSRELSAPLWSRYADRVGENRVKSLRSKRRIARAPAGGLGGRPPPNIGHKCPELALNGTYVVPKWYEPLGRGHLTYCL